MSLSPQATPLPLFLSPLQTFSKMSVCVCVYMYVCVTHIIGICAQSLQSCPTLRARGLQARLLCPGDSPGKNTGVGCHALLQGIFPTQGLNPGLLHVSCIDRWVLYHCASWESLYVYIHTRIIIFISLQLISGQHEIRSTYHGHGLFIIYRWPSISMDPLSPRFCIL